MTQDTIKFKTAIRLILSMVAGCYALIYIVFLCVDPYQLRERSSEGWDKFKYTRLFSRFQYEALQTSNYSLIFGSSRIQKISSDRQGYSLLNFHNLYSEPGDILSLLAQLSDEQIQNIDRVFIELDVAAFREEEGPNIQYELPSAVLIAQFSLPLKPDAILSVARELYLNTIGQSYYRIAVDGSLKSRNDNIGTFVPEMPTRRIFNGNSYNRSAIKSLSEINRFLANKGVDVRFHTPTYTDRALRQMNWDVIAQALEELISSGVAFTNNYFIDGISNNQVNGVYPHFSDASHLNGISANEVFLEYVQADNGLLIQDVEQLHVSVRTLKSL